MRAPIYTSVRVSGMKIVWHRPGGTNGCMSENGISYENSLVFIYIPFGHSLSAQFLGLKGLGNGGNRIACLIRGEAVLIAQTRGDF